MEIIIENNINLHIMAQKKGQTGNPNGRPKGTPNKATQDLRAWIDGLLNDNRDMIISDLRQIEPYQRLQIVEKLMQYTIPKQQSISIEAQIQAEFAAIERLLSNAPDKAIEAITERLMKLNLLNKQNYE